MTRRTDEPLPDGVSYRRAPECFWRRAAGVVVVLPPDEELAVRLEGPAAMLWEALYQPATLDDLVDVLAGLYGSDIDLVRPAIATSLADLCERAVIVLDREPCPA